MTESEWIELKKGKVYAHFAMTETTSDHVELYDKSRRIVDSPNSNDRVLLD